MENLGVEISIKIHAHHLNPLQYNPHRTTLRRPPQIITSLRPVFNELEFNFNKINEKEILFNVRFDATTSSVVSFIINNSPLTKYHILLVPRLKENLPQLFTQETMHYAIQLLHNLNDSHFRIGYNSPGALASVNHLHLHLLYIEQCLSIENVVMYCIILNHIGGGGASHSHILFTNNSSTNKTSKS